MASLVDQTFFHYTPYIINLRNIRDALNSIKSLVNVKKSLEVYEGCTSSVCKISGYSLVLQVDSTGLEHHDKFLESQEGLSVDSPTYAYLQTPEEYSSQSAVTVVMFFISLLEIISSVKQSPL